MLEVSVNIHVRFIIQNSSSCNFIKNKRNLNLEKGILKFKIFSFEKLLCFFSFCELIFIYRKLRAETTSWTKWEIFFSFCESAKKIANIFYFLMWKLKVLFTKSFFKIFLNFFCYWSVIADLMKRIFWLWSPNR